MAKRLFLLLFVCFMGMISSPQFLMADDFIRVSRVNDDLATQTEIILPEPDVVPEVEVEPMWNEASYDYEKVYYQPNYNVTIVTDEIVDGDLSYYDIYRTDKFIYAHNTANLLGSIIYMYEGMYFSITENGVATTYQVITTAIYEKAENGYLNGDKELTKDVEYEASGYSISMMTCYGTMLGNGDATHRFVVFADAV